MRLGIVVQDEAYVDQLIKNLAMADEEAATFRKNMAIANQTTLQAAKIWADLGLQLVATPISQLPPVPDLKACNRLRLSRCDQSLPGWSRRQGTRRIVRCDHRTTTKRT